MSLKRITNSIGAIQADSISNSVIHQYISAPPIPDNLDEKINAAQKRLFRLKTTKGLHDIRIPLAVISSIFLVSGFSICGFHSFSFVVSSILCLSFGLKLSSHIDLLDSEIRATKNILDKYCEIRAMLQIDKK